MNLQKIIETTQVSQITGSPDIEIKAITQDSRKCNAETLFIAIRGAKADGHNYISSVEASGCKAIVCEEAPATPSAGVCYIIVPDTHIAIGTIAHSFYGNPSKKMKLVGVTGTNGKTTIATLLYRLFNAMGKKAGLFSTVANYIIDEKIPTNNTTPDAITLASLMSQMVEKGVEYCFMEVSSHAVVQHRIEGLDFDGALFTNLTHDHLDFHKTFAAYIDAKKGFFDALKPEAFAITNIDDKNGSKMLQNTMARKRSYSLRSMSDYKGQIIEQGFEGTQMTFNNTEATMLFTGKFNAYNLLAIYGAAIELGEDSNEVLRVLSTLKPVDGRFETLHGTGKRVTAIVDYAHTPDALINVMSTINAIRKPSQQLITIAGCGGDRDKTKRPEMAVAAVENSTITILTSDNPRTEEPEAILNDMFAGLDAQQATKAYRITDRRDAIRMAVQLAKEGDIILIAGKGHEDYQEINGVKHHFSDKEEVLKLINA